MSEQSTPDHPRRKNQPPLVLVVDDDEYLVRAIQFILKENEFRCASAATGEAALKAVEKLHPDVIYLDLLLPDVDGFDLIKQIREVTSAAIIVLSALPETEKRNKAMAVALGANEFISKPFDENELMAKTRVLARKPA